MVTVTLVLLNSDLIMAGDLSQQEETFYLKSGDKVSGIITTETDSTYVVKAAFGSVTIQKADIIPEDAVEFQYSSGSIDYYQMGYDQADKDIKAGDWAVNNVISFGAVWMSLPFYGIPFVYDRFRGVNVPYNNEVSQNGKSEYEEGYKERIEKMRVKIYTYAACSLPVMGLLAFGLAMGMAGG